MNLETKRINFFNRRSINLDITHRCTLQCPKCNRQLFTLRGLKVPGQDMTVSQFKKIIKFVNKISFCGQISDPIFNPYFLEFLKLTYDNNIKVDVKTAASHKSKDWYVKAFKQNPNAQWTFGIDGLPKDSHKHRVNQDGEYLFDIMLLSKKYIKKTTWQCIVFSYNENNIKQLKQMAKKNDLELKFFYSSRFYEDDPLKPKNKEYFIKRDWKPRASLK
tara:strand:- start:2846 stop:3499 length:654 start_codon:yes stop_codon:yes gene_type:complete